MAWPDPQRIICNPVLAEKPPVRNCVVRPAALWESLVLPARLGPQPVGFVGFVDELLEEGRVQLLDVAAPSHPKVALEVAPRRLLHSPKIGPAHNPSSIIFQTPGAAAEQKCVHFRPLNMVRLRMEVEDYRVGVFFPAAEAVELVQGRVLVVLLIRGHGQIRLNFDEPWIAFEQVVGDAGCEGDGGYDFYLHVDVRRREEGRVDDLCKLRSD